MHKRCPKCKSLVQVEDKLSFIECQKCGYDELDDVDNVFPMQKTSQREKAQYSPYKTGGSERSIR